MNGLDYALIVIVLLSIVCGLMRGVILEVFHIAGWIIAFIMAQVFMPVLRPYFSDWMIDPGIRTLIAWGAIFLGTLVATALVANFVSGLVRKIGLGVMDRGLGAAFGLARGAILVLLLAVGAGFTTFPATSIWKDAMLAPWMEAGALCVKPFLPENLAARLSYRPKESPIKSAEG